MSELGVTVIIRDAATLDDVGVCHAPAPVEPGDLLAFDRGDPYRVIATLPVPEGATVVPVPTRDQCGGRRDEQAGEVGGREKPEEKNARN